MLHARGRKWACGCSHRSHRSVENSSLFVTSTWTLFISCGHFFVGKPGQAKMKAENLSQAAILAFKNSYAALVRDGHLAILVRGLFGRSACYALVTLANMFVHDLGFMRAMPWTHVWMVHWLVER